MTPTLYTEFHGQLHIRNDVSKTVFLALGHMVDPDSDGAPRPLPQHRLFKTPGWKNLLRSRSGVSDVCLTPTMQGVKDDWVLTFGGSLDNKDRTINDFINWIGPYVNTGKIQIRKNGAVGWNAVSWNGAPKPPKTPFKILPSRN